MLIGICFLIWLIGIPIFVKIDEKLKLSENFLDDGRLGTPDKDSFIYESELGITRMKLTFFWPVTLTCTVIVWLSVVLLLGFEDFINKIRGDT